jgi:hypothetical protein
VALVYQVQHYQKLGLTTVPPILSKTSVTQVFIYCFIGASPDRRVFDSECATSHWGLLEIKCTPADSVANCDYLSVPKTSREGMLQLKHSHSYYYQIMGQMGITGAAWCDFFVFSCNDFHMERIMFDDNFFQKS